MSKSFYYPWHFQDWQSSIEVAQLTLAERGLLRELIDLQFQHGRLPEDKEALKRMCRCSGKEFERAWKGCEHLVENRDGHYFVRLLEDRLEAFEKSRDFRLSVTCKASVARQKQRKQLKNKPIDTPSWSIDTGVSKAKAKDKSKNENTTAAKNLDLSRETETSSSRNPSDEDLEGVADLVAYWSNNRITADRETCRRILEAWPNDFDSWGAAVKSRCLHLEPSSISSPGWFLALTRSLAKEIDSG